MQNLESLKANGELRVVLTGADGQVKEDVLLKNLVVDTGLNFIVNRMKEHPEDYRMGNAPGGGQQP